MQLLVHIEYSLKNNMMLTNTEETYFTDEGEVKRAETNHSNIRGYIIDFLTTLTIKGSELPSMSNFLFSDSRAGYRKGSYLPI
jgi:hypothetical protein